MERLNEQDRKVILKALMPKIKKDFKTKEKINGEEKGAHGYRVILQGKTFYTVLSDEQLGAIIEKCMDIYDEMINIYEGGFTFKEIKRYQKEYGISRDFGDNVAGFIKYYGNFATERIKDIVCELDEICGVGGAYAILISNPTFSSAIVSTYDRLVDGYENENKDYTVQTIYFLIRAAMKMRGVEEKEKMKKIFEKENKWEQEDFKASEKTE